MPENTMAVVIPLLGWMLLTGTINLAFGYKSQIEAWVESKPRLAALLKFSRSVGFDPWNLLAAWKLAASKKLPDAQKANSAIAKHEQRKADAKRLGPPSGGSGALDVGPRVPFDVEGEKTPPSLPGVRAVVWRWMGKEDTAMAIGVVSMALALAALLLVGCNLDARPCSAEDLASGPLAANNARCAAERQAKFPNLSDDDCMLEPGCAALIAECDRFVDERCK
jgi:hypothetical protein